MDLTPAPTATAAARSAADQRPSPALPVVAVVDSDLVTRRRRMARPLLWGVAAAFGVLVAVANLAFDGLSLGWRWGIVGGAALVFVAVLAWALPWAGPRTGATWVVGVEADGLRVQHPLAADGHAALPWAAIASVRRARYLLLVPIARVRLAPDAEWALGPFSPSVRRVLLRRGIAIGLQGSSMTPRELVQLVAQVGGTRVGGRPS